MASNNPVPVSLGSQSNPGRDGAISAARLINCYAENAGAEGIAQLPIVAADGFTSFQTISGGGAIRALFQFDESTVLGLSGTKLFKIVTDGTVTELATVSVTGHVSFARNRRSPNAQAAMVAADGTYSLIDMVTNAVTNPTMPTGEAPNSVCAMGGYFLFTRPNGEFFISDINNGDLFYSLDFSDAEINPDGLLIGVTRGSDACLFGPKSCEFFQNLGDVDFPFERVAATAYGCHAVGSVKNINAIIDGRMAETVVFVANDAEDAFAGVYMMSGYTAIKISTDAVDRAIEAEGTASADIRGFTWIRGGHSFYAIVGENMTWVYDATTGLWHERTSSGLNRWRVNDTVVLNGNTLAGDYSSATLYTMSPATVSASSSSVTVQTSQDNGDTYSTARTTAISSSDREQRFKWNRFGQSKEDGFVIKMAITNAVDENGTGNPMTIIPPHLHAWPRRLILDSIWANVVPASSTTSRSKAVTSLAVTARPAGSA